MLENLPFYISAIFGLTTLATLLLFCWAIKNADTIQVQKKASFIFLGMSGWLAVQAGFTLSGYYNNLSNALPPKIVLTGILPAIALVVFLFATTAGRQFIDSLPLKHITYINTVRIPVELVLFWLYLNKAVPQLMTFEGRNLDIIAGVTAPLIAYFGFTKNSLGRTTLVAWNFICLGLLLNIVIHAFLATPSPLQQFAFEQPNVAILYFPFSWLPTYIVPVILLGHLISLRQLLHTQRKN